MRNLVKGNLDIVSGLHERRGMIGGPRQGVNTELAGQLLHVVRDNEFTMAFLRHFKFRSTPSAPAGSIDAAMFLVF